MPTGYTQIIEDGCTFEQYAMRCARAFGALVQMREAPLDEEIPEEIQDSGFSYYEESLRRDREELHRLLNLTQAQIEAECTAESDRRRKAFEEACEDYRKKTAQYNAMKAKVESWTPPTPDHAELKRFMLQQIETSLPIQPTASWYLVPDASKWRIERISELTRSIERNDVHVARAKASAKESTWWVKTLRESLKSEAAR